MTSPNEESEPQVGIFWLFQRKLIIDSTPLHAAEPYGDNFTHPRSHIRYWTDLQRRREVSAEVEYEEPPRGRVVFDWRRDLFVLLADKCILERAQIVRCMMRQMSLPVVKTETGRDAHYRCKKCLLGEEPTD